MKTKIGQKAKSVLSLLLTVCMLLSVMSVGVASFGAAEADVAEDGAQVDIASDGYTAASITSDGTAKLFFNLKPSSIGTADNRWWPAGTNGDKNFAYFYNSSTEANAWSAHSEVYSGDINYVNIPVGTWDHVILTRNDTTTAPTWTNKWNQTDYIKLKSDDNYLSDFSEGSNNTTNKVDGTWGTDIKPVSTAGLSASATTVNARTAVTLTPALTSNTDYNVIKSNSYSVKRNGSNATLNTDYQISDNTFTPLKSGTYVVTDTITYNPKGYASLTSTVAPTVTITSNQLAQLPTPTITVKKAVGGTVTTSPASANNTDTVTVTIDNYDDLKDYCSFSISPAGTLNNGVYTMTGLSSSGSGTNNSISVTATIKNEYLTTYSFNDAISSQSSVNTLKVYKPVFSLVGDNGKDYLSTSAATTLSGDGKWTTHVADLDISTITDTPGVYTKTITTNDVDTLKDNSHSNINIGLLYNSSGSTWAQKGVRTGSGTYRYYDSNGADFAVPDYGVTDGMNMYIKDGTGSLALQPGRTYTITIDQTKTLVSGDKGKITITSSTDPSGFDLHFGTASQNQGFGTYTDAFGNSVSESGSRVAMEKVSGQTKYTVKQRLTAGNTYYYYVTSPLAGQHTGVYFKTATDSGATATEGTAVNMWTFGGNSGLSWGDGTWRMVSYECTETSNYIFTFDYSDPNNPTITVVNGDYNVTVEPKKKDFDPTARALKAVEDADAETFVVTANGSTTAGVDKDNVTPVTLDTAEVSGYTFKGWYTNAACTTAATLSGKQYTPNASVTLYALYEQDAPHDNQIRVTAPVGMNISADDGVAGDSSPYNAYTGATVTLSYDVTDDSKMFAGWDVKTAHGKKITVADDNTFTMPNEAVIVTATIVDKPKAKVNVSTRGTDDAGDPLGTVVQTTPAAGTNIYIGETEITLTATPNSGYVFKGWTLDGARLTADPAQSLSDTTITVKADSATVNAVASFDYKEYQLYYNGGTIPMIRQSDGSYISAGTVNSNSTQNKDQFTVYNASDGLYAYSGAGGSYDWLIDGSHLTADIGNTTSASENAWKSAAPGNGNLYRQNHGSARYVKYIPASAGHANGQITTLSSYGEGVTMANVYAKEGTIRLKEGDDSSLYTDGGDVTAAFATYTKVTKIDDSEVSALPAGIYASKCRKYEIPMDSNITVETRLTDTMINQHWYVSHFVVNGWKVSATKMRDGVYTCSFDLSDDYKIPANASYANLDTNAFEITPVLYNTDIENDTSDGGGYITFYVDADEIPAHWGSTVSAEFYYKGATNTHWTGTYPGVPMARVGKYYELKIPRSDYSLSGGVMTKGTHPFSSLTISAYFADTVHHYIYKADNTKFWSDGTNYQTYDYADAGSLAKIPNIQAIMFRNKYETSKTNKDKDANWEAPTGGTEVNAYQVLSDYYGNAVDLFGNVLKDGSGNPIKASTLSESDAQVKVLSQGNYNTESLSTRTKGKYSTKWRAFAYYSGDTKWWRVAEGTAADFINETPGTDTITQNITYYKDGKFGIAEGTNYTNSLLINKVTFISYEKELQSGVSGDTGKRSDGQWYYSSLGNEFNSTVEVGYMGAEAASVTGSTVTQDANSNAENTGWIGNATKTKATLDAKTTATYTNVTTNAALNVSVGSGYTFVGWYLKEGTGNAAKYTKIGDNYKDLSTTFLMNNTYTFVAVVKAVPSGSLVITHNKYTGKTPQAHTGGIAKYYVSAKVIHEGGGEETIAEAQNSITVPGLAATDKIQITLRTKCSGDDEFYAWYEEVLGDNYSPTGVFYEICDEQSDKAGEKEASYQFFAADCAKFFEGGELKRQSLDFYSDIVHVSASAKLTYQYYDRFNVKTGGISATPKRVEYVVDNVELSVDEIENGYRPSDETIAKYAPKIVDTLYVDTKWIIDSNTVEKNKANALITATQELKDCAVQYVDPTDIASLLEGNTELAPTDYGDWINEDVPFNSLLAVEGTTLENYTDDSFYVNAPQQITVGDKTWNFVRFDVYSYNSDTAKFGDILYSSNDHIFEYRIYADCAIYPVYTTDTVTPELTATIQAPIFNREVYTNDLGNLVDRLYADMLVGYINTSSIPGVPEIIKDNKSATSGYEIETGTLVDYHLNLTDADYATLSNAGKAKTDDTTDTILAGYTGAYSREQLTSFLEGTALANVRKTVISADKLTNKNRVDQVYRYSNTEKNQKSIFIVYSYVMLTKKSTGEKTIAISMKPQIYNFAYYGNRPLVNE